MQVYDQGETEADGYGRFTHLGIDPHEEVKVDDQRQTDREVRMRKIYSFRPLPLIKGCRCMTREIQKDRDRQRDTDAEDLFIEALTPMKRCRWTTRDRQAERYGDTDAEDLFI